MIPFRAIRRTVVVMSELAAAVDTAGASCLAHGHRLGGDGREAVLVDDDLWCRQCAEFYDQDFKVVA